MKNTYKVGVLVLGLMCFIAFSDNVRAAGSIKASANPVVKGNTVTITAVISSDKPIVSIEGSLSCNGAGVSGGADLKFEDSSNSVYSKSFTYSARVNTAGTITCSLNGARYTDMGSDNWKSVDASTISVKVNEPVKVPPKQLSSDNNLKSLSIEGYELSPAFNKDTLEYRLTVDESIEKINIKGEVNDSKAKVEGLGEVKLTNGENSFEIKVIAENGNDKVYKLIVKQEDQHPLNTKIGKDNLVIVKRNNDLVEKLEGYEEKIIKIDNQDVISYYNSKTKTTLVLLKDKDNNIKYYVYDKKKNTYREYNALSVNGVSLELIGTNKKLSHFTKYKLKKDGKTIDYYKVNKDDRVGLVYGTNILTGNTGYYVYDTEENTLSRYYDKEIALYKKDIDKLKSYLMLFCGVVSLVVIIVVIVSIVKGGKRRKRKIKV